MKKGEWYDLTYRMLVCNFNELVKYVEQEKGLDTLEWEKSLVYDKEWGYDEGHEKYGQLTDQALGANEQERLYKWWKEVYPNRPDAYDVSGLSALYKQYGFNKPDDVVEEWKACHELCSKIEQEYEQEDEEMLIALMKIRQTLWS